MAHLDIVFYVNIFLPEIILACVNLCRKSRFCLNSYFPSANFLWREFNFRGIQKWIQFYCLKEGAEKSQME